MLLEAVRYFRHAANNPAPATRESDLRKAQKAVNSANYCLRHAIEEGKRETGTPRSRRTAMQPGDPLTLREMEVAHWLTTGLSN